MCYSINQVAKKFHQEFTSYLLTQPEIRARGFNFQEFLSEFNTKEDKSVLINLSKNPSFQRWLDRQPSLYIPYPKEWLARIEKIFDLNNDYIFFERRGRPKFLKIFQEKLFYSLIQTIVPYTGLKTNQLLKIDKYRFGLYLINSLKQYQWAEDLSETKAKELRAKFTKPYYKIDVCHIDHFKVEYSAAFVELLLEDFHTAKLISNPRTKSEYFTISDREFGKKLLIYRSIYAVISTLPLFTLPKKFTHQEFLHKTIIGGEFTRPPRILSPLTLTSDLRLLADTSFSKTFLTDMNKLQEIPVLLLPNFFTYLLDLKNHAPDKIIKFFDMLLFFSDLKPESLLKAELSTFLKNSDDYINDESIDWLSISENPTGKLKMLTYAENSFKIFYTKIEKLSQTFSLLRFYNNFLMNKTPFLYFPLFLDYRGRIYSQSWLSPTSSKLFRRLLIFPNNNFPHFSTKPIFDSIYYKFWLSFQYEKSKSLLEALSKLDSFKQKDYLMARNPHNVLFVELYHKEEFFKEFDLLISFDAPASMMQIIACILKDTKMMKYTNLLVENNEDKIYDIYQDLIIEKLKIDNNVLSLQPHFQTLILNRKIVKYILMVYVYGASLRTIIDHLKSDFHLHYMYNVHIRLIVDIIIKQFDFEFPKFILLKKTLQKIASYLYSVDRGCKITLPDKIIHYKHNIEVRKTFTFLDKSFETIIRQQTTNPRRGAAGFLANIIHFLDSSLLTILRTELLKEKIPSYGIHDSLLISPFHAERAIQLYNKLLFSFFNKDNFDFFSLINLDSSTKSAFLNSMSKKLQIKFAADLETIEYYSKQTFPEGSFLSSYALIPE